MSLADPLAPSAFLDLMKAEDVQFVTDWAQKRSMAAGGVTLYADRAPGMWKASIATRPMLWSDVNEIMALIDSRQGGLKSVLLYNPRGRYPSTDPGGTLFGAATPAVGTITDQLHVAFTGFPANYVVPAGTFVQIIFDTSRYYLGQFAEARTASGAGAISSVELSKPLPDSVQTGDVVTVVKPCAKFKIVPGSAYFEQATANRARIRFAAEQTYQK